MIRPTLYRLVISRRMDLYWSFDSAVERIGGCNHQLAMGTFVLLP